MGRNAVPYTLIYNKHEPIMNAYSKITACIVAALALTSCNTGSDKEQELSYTYQFELSSNDFSETGKWTYTDDTSVQNLSFPPFLFVPVSLIHYFAYVK